MRYIKVGVITGTHGLKGEVAIKELTEFREQRFSIGSKLYLEIDHHYELLTIVAVRFHKDRLLVKFEGYDQISQVEKWRKSLLYVSEEEIEELAEDEIYYWQLRECKVFDENGYVGDVIELIETGASVILRVKGEQEEILVPYVKAFFPEVDILNRKLTLKRMEGLS